jgi:hypothetical protein
LVPLQVFSALVGDKIQKYRNITTNNSVNMRQCSIAREYADANTQNPKEYWDYDTLTLQYG